MPKEHVTYQDRIVIDPTIVVGKPVVKGTRIPVVLVLAKLARKPDFKELFADYPRLTIEDVQACLEYAKTLVEKEKKARPTPPSAARRPS
ncbi:MAG: DUF433 domain-containing protein [Chloroflexi bacterium]|nr:DUF433 domain-containing protein [Chloroflexota bacterium]